MLNHVKILYIEKEQQQQTKQNKTKQKFKAFSL